MFRATVALKTTVTLRVSCVVGSGVGTRVGVFVGPMPVGDGDEGTAVGAEVGTGVGRGVGASVGTGLGEEEGGVDGDPDGRAVGEVEGRLVGRRDGGTVGANDTVGEPVGTGEGLRVETAKEMEVVSMLRPVASVRALLNSGETSVSTIDAARASPLLSPISSRDAATAPPSGCAASSSFRTTSWVPTSTTSPRLSPWKEPKG